MASQSQSHGQSFYENFYTSWAGHYRSQHNLNPAIPLGETNPNSLPSPTNPQALKDAIDALAVAAGLTQAQIDAAESG